MNIEPLGITIYDEETGEVIYDGDPTPELTFGEPVMTIHWDEHGAFRVQLGDTEDPR